MKHTEMIIVIQAHSEGKTIEYDENLIWKVAKDPSWNFERRNYRVKPEPVYDTQVLMGNKYVEIKALEDAMELIESHYNWPALSKAKIAALKELL